MNEIIYKKKNQVSLFIIYCFLLLALIPLKSLQNPQLLGEDEALTYIVNINLLDYLSNFNLKGFISELIKDWHPPGRNLLSLLSISVFGENITSLRIPYYILWICTCILGILITKNFSDTFSSYICVTLLAGSGLFHIQTMGFGHGFITFTGMLIIYLITNKKWISYNKFSYRKFIYLSIILYVGFLFFNTIILITMMIHFIQLFIILKYSNKINDLYIFLLISFIISVFYIIYLLIFIGLPMLMVNSNEFLLFFKNTFNLHDFGNWKGENFGQYHQYVYRHNMAKLNVLSLLKNIKYLNWHFFPFLAIFIIFFGFFILYNYFKIILYLILPYFLIMNFYMFGNTEQHFVSLFIWIIPFFSIAAYKYKINFNVKKIIGILVICFFIPFTTFAHIYSYYESDYPFKIANSLYGKVKWPPNLNRPLKKISEDIIKKIKIHDHIGYSIDGALVIYYLKNYKSSQIPIPKLGTSTGRSDCKKLSKKFKVLIVNNYETKGCSEQVKEKLTYENSKINVIVFK